MKSKSLVKSWKSIQGFLRNIINSNIYCIINVMIILLNIFALSDGKSDNYNTPSNPLEYFLQSDVIFTIYFIFESLISILADGIKDSFTKFWGLFNVFIFFFEYSNSLWTYKFISITFMDYFKIFIKDTLIK